MRIALDATSLPPRRLGAATYILSLARELPGVARAGRVCAIAQPEAARELASIEGLEILRAPRMRPLVRVIWEQIALPAFCREAGVDLLHSPHYTLPVARGGRAVVSFHDLTFFSMPGVHLGYKRLFFRRMIPLAAGRAQAVIVPSASTRDDLARLLPGCAAKTHVIPLGVGHQFGPVKDPVARESVRSRYNLPPAFYLYVGNLEPRKNLPVLLEAYARLVGRGGTLPLVLAGPAGWKDKPFWETVRRLELEPHLVLPGYVAHEDLPAVYSLASAFIYPSRYEGFGLPVLEAMACGTPVITSNVSSMPEVAGDAALLVAPEDVDGLARAIDRLGREASLRAELSQRSQARARQFTWRHAAEATWAVYEQVMAAG